MKSQKNSEIGLFRDTLFINNELDLLIKKRGGLFFYPGETFFLNEKTTILDLERTINLFIQDLRSVFYTESSRRIEFSFISNLDTGAFSYASANNSNPFDFIGINVGSTFKLIEIFSHILCRSDTFENIGNPHLEENSRSTLSYLSPQSTSIDDYLNYPLCEIRRKFCSGLVQFSLFYIAAHEITHLQNGHVDFIRDQKKGTPTSDIFDFSSNSKVEKLTSQTLEWDADCGALKIMIDFCLSIFRNKENKKDKTIEEKTISLMFSDLSTTFFNLFYAIYSLFRIQGNIKWDFINQPKYSHPLTPIRMYWIMEIATAIFNKRKAELAELNYDPTKDFIAALIKAEIDFSRILMEEKPTKPYILDTIKSTARTEYLQALSDRWRQIRPLLDKKKRGGNLAD